MKLFKSVQSTNRAAINNMKFIIVALAVFGFAAAAPQPRGLPEDLQSVWDLVPVDDITAIVDNYLTFDGQVQYCGNYLQGPEWAALVAKVNAEPTWDGFKVWLMEQGVDADQIVLNVHNWIAAREVGTNVETEDLRAFLDEVEAIIPLAAIVAQWRHLKETSPIFLEAIERLESDAGEELANKVLHWPEVEEVRNTLTEFGANVDGALTVLFELLGYAPWSP